MKILKFKIVTAERVVYENEILQASIPTASGEITVLPDHLPIVSILQTGEIKLKDKDGDQSIAVAGGFLEMRVGNELIILADKAERAGEIDVERAEEAQKRAQKQMEEAKNIEDFDFAKVQALIDKEMNRIRIGKKYRKLRYN
jgi:F-type H+-transporting ATPase subunit epsilon